MIHARAFLLFSVSVVLSAVLSGCTDKEQAAQLAAQAEELAALKAQDATEQANLANFDDLDFNVFSGQKWEDLGKSHHADIVVHWPDGHSTTGIDVHTEDLKKMFVYAPDTRVKEHPVKIAQGEWTAVMGVMEGTFTQPMPAANGKTIAPTGKTFRLPMATFGRWVNGVMVEEYLYWDNAAFMQQIGLTP